METRHLVRGGEGGILDGLLRSLLRIVRVGILGMEARSKVDLEAVDDLVVELDVREEGVGVVPGLSEGEAMLTVGVLCLDVADDNALAGLVPGDLEDDVRGRRGLDLEECVANGVLLAEEVERGLSKVLLKLFVVRVRPRRPPLKEEFSYLPGWGNGLGNRHCTKGRRCWWWCGFKTMATASSQKKL